MFCCLENHKFYSKVHFYLKLNLYLFIACTQRIHKRVKRWSNSIKKKFKERTHRNDSNFWGGLSGLVFFGYLISWGLQGVIPSTITIAGIAFVLSFIGLVMDNNPTFAALIVATLIVIAFVFVFI